LLARASAVLVLAQDREPPSDVFNRIAQAGYVMDTVHRRVTVPERFSGAPRRVTITRLYKKTAQPASGG